MPDRHHDHPRYSLKRTACTALLLGAVLISADARAGVELYIDNLGNGEPTPLTAPGEPQPLLKAPAAPPVQEETIEKLPDPEPVSTPVAPEEYNEPGSEPEETLLFDKEAPPEANLTLITALRDTYMNNPDIRAARAELRAIEEQLPQALSGWKPTVSARAAIEKAEIDGSNFGSAEGSVAKDMIVQIEQPIYRGGRTTAQTRAARNTITAQNALLKQTEQAVLLDAATAYMDVTRDIGILVLNENNVKLLEEQAQAAQNRFTVGEITRTDVSQAESRLAAARSALIRAQGQLETTRAAFEKIIGYKPDGYELENRPVSLALPASLDDALALSQEENPAVVASIFIQKAAEDDVDTVFGELLPEVGAYASWNKTYDPQPGTIPEQTTKLAGLSATIPLYQAGAVRSRIRQAKEQANKNYLEILSARNQVKQDTISSWQNLSASRAEIAARQAQVEAAAIAQEGARAELDVGTRSTLDSLDADQEYLDARVALVEAQRDEIVVFFALSATLGLLTPENLGFSTDKPTTGSYQETVKSRIFSTQPSEKESKNVDSVPYP